MAAKIGDRFGRLVVLERVGQRARCRCDCGIRVEPFSTNLVAGVTRSCGCLRREEARERPVTHGLRRGGEKHPLYETWKSMHKRCEYEKDKRYARYGGRGISVCERWSGVEGFPNFVADMGARPDGYLLDRRDNDGNYEPTNCWWATVSESNLNRDFSNFGRKGGQ